MDLTGLSKMPWQRNNRTTERDYELPAAYRTYIHMNKIGLSVITDSSAF